MSTVEKARYTRANLALLDVFTQIMRDLLRSKVMSITSLETMVQHKNFQKMLSEKEKTLLKTIEYDELDIGIIYKIIRFFKFVQAPSRSWGFPPLPNDKKIADDIERIRIMRNSLAHKPNPVLSEENLESMFSDFADMSNRFDTYMNQDPNNGYSKAVDNYKTGSIDPERERQYKDQIDNLEEKYQVMEQGRRINIYFGKDTQDIFTSEQSGDTDTRLKVYLPNVIDPGIVTKVLMSMIMEIVKMNYEIILDNVGSGSLILYITVTKHVKQNQNQFVKRLGTFLVFLITKGEIDFGATDYVEAVISNSDPLIDYSFHTAFSECDSIYDADVNSSDEENESDEQKDLCSRIEMATFQMPASRLGSGDVEKALIEEATKYNCENIEKELRLVMIGKTGVGKSALGNFICGKSEFLSKQGASSTTSSCTFGQCILNNRTVMVIDTPGIFGTEQNTEYVEDQIRKCIGMGAPGPHAILFVMSLAERFKIEDKKAIREFMKFFGTDMLKYVVVVFTHSDVLGEQSGDMPDQLKELLQSCGNRYVRLNTQAEGDERDTQLNMLLTEIQNLKLKNYEDENFKITEKLLIKREEEICAEVERRLKKREEEIKEEVERRMKEREKEIKAETEKRLELVVADAIKQMLLPVQKQAIHRLMTVRDEVRSEIEDDQSQFVTSGSKLIPHHSVIKRFPDK